MLPITLDVLTAETTVTRLSSGLSVLTQRSWVVEGENHLSYATLTRLVECCREHHWNVDVVPWINGTKVDSITKSITFEFVQPVLVRRRVNILYNVSEVRQRGYRLRFQVMNRDNRVLHAACELVSVFYDPVSRQIRRPPLEVCEHLQELCGMGATSICRRDYSTT